MSSTSIVDHNDTVTLECMGAEVLQLEDLTDDEEEEISCPVTTVADLDPAQFGYDLGPILDGKNYMVRSDQELSYDGSYCMVRTDLQVSVKVLRVLCRFHVPPRLTPKTAEETASGQLNRSTEELAKVMAEKRIALDLTEGLFLCPFIPIYM